MSTNFKFAATVISATVAACIGKRLGFETLREVALEHGSEGLAAFGEACRIEFLARGVHSPKRESFALMQKDKCPGVSTFYTYITIIGKLVKRIEAGDAKAADEMLNLTASKACTKGGKGKTGAGAGAKAPQPEVKLLTVDDAIQCILAAHKAGTLTAPQYAALQGLIPAPVRTRHMGDAVEVGALLSA